MEAAVLGLIDHVESLRTKLLRFTLQFNIVKQAFCSRSARLFLLFVLATIFYLPLSLYFPLWVLAIGPIIWGIPHIFSSFRFQGYVLDLKISKSIQKTVYFISAVWMPMTLFRIGTDVAHVQWAWDQNHPAMLETGLAAVSVLGLAYLSKFNIKQAALSILIFIPLLMCLIQWPLATTGILILLHNFIAFFYWIISSRNRSDRFVAILATLVFALIHALMFEKYFDGLINLFPSESFLGWAKFNLDEIGQSIVPWSSDASLLYRCVSLYAFGQALHYFVWLKAIPDTFAPRAVPTNFKQAWRLLKRDIGLRPALFICVLALIPAAIFILVNYDLAQRMYFACASVHGFVEIAGLGLIFGRRVAI